MGINQRLYNDYLTSGLDADAWKADRRVRAHTRTVELSGGMAMGSVDRAYTLRLVLEDGDGGFTEADRYEEDLLLGGIGGHGSVAFGIAPFARWELGLKGGIQQGHKHLTTGFELFDGAVQEDASTFAPDPVVAIVAFFEPRVRFYPRPVGIVKPYLGVHGQLRVYDPILVEDSNDVTYQPGRPTLVPFGVGASAGLMLDVSPTFSVFIEAPFTQLVVNQSAYRTAVPDRLEDPPAPNVAVTNTLQLTAGIGVKF